MRHFACTIIFVRFSDRVITCLTDYKLMESIKAPARAIDEHT